MQRILCSLALLAATALVVTGCGGTSGAYPVKGKVTLQDGTPVKGGIIYFQGDKVGANSAIADDGTYALGSETPGDGAMPGKYKVYIGGDPLGGGYDNLPPQIDAKYGNVSTSGLEYEVKAETNTIDIKLDPPAK